MRLTARLDRIETATAKQRQTQAERDARLAKMWENAGPQERQRMLVVLAGVLLRNRGEDGARAILLKLDWPGGVTEAAAAAVETLIHTAAKQQQGAAKAAVPQECPV